MRANCRSLALSLAGAVSVIALADLSFAQQAVIKPLTPGIQSATPIEIPFWPAIVDPKKRPDLFKVLPVPVPGTKIVSGHVGRYAFKQNETGLIMGQTRFGYAYFKNRADYDAFLKRFP